jgi:hypothetical protein
MRTECLKCSSIINFVLLAFGLPAQATAFLIFTPWSLLPWLWDQCLWSVCFWDQVKPASLAFVLQLAQLSFLGFFFFHICSVSKNEQVTGTFLTPQRQNLASLLEEGRVNKMNLNYFKFCIVASVHSTLFYFFFSLFSISLWDFAASSNCCEHL